MNIARARCNTFGPHTTVLRTSAADPNVDAAQKLRMADLRPRADALKTSLANDIAERRAALGAAPPVRSQTLLAVPSACQYGRMEWRVVGDGTRVSHGVAYTSAEVFCAKRNQLRVDFMGNGEVVSSHSRPVAARRGRCSYRGETFERVRTDQASSSRAR